MLVWMAINSGGACAPIRSVMRAPQSPPCATYFLYPRRFISTFQARAIRSGPQPVVVGLLEKPYPGIEGITTSKASAAGSAMGRRIGQWLDELELLEDRTRPSVRNDDRQRILMLRTDMDEVNVETIDLGDEVRQRVEPRLDLAPVVFRAPVASQLLDGRERHA